MDASPTLLPTDARLPALPPAVPRRRYPIAKVLGWLLLKALGWRYVGGFTNAPRQVLIGWPHTSNWDGIIGLGAAALCGIDVNVLAKRALFRPPVGWILRSFGGIPVERTRPGGLVEEAIERFEAAEASGGTLVLAMAPEGTRGRGEGWKTGFHRIAVRAGVPIAVLCFDYRRKEIGVVGTVVPSGDLDQDLAAISALLVDVRGRHPEKATPAASGVALPPTETRAPRL
ncbi:1-acyl-sn-glycerol-3-phosphate acyltransferase [Rubricoccus marinus]|uniref:Phospholipid/glycerol acyltransferase domain-containing protein n=1 Tax=Rubricoccus marinus TaxID=716817 RepID=A0A259TZD8_9BACT|nr:1-acyl-sn-glycerol-3-phosphate acyltransferase [Rubricoccus marinus]OZC03145.1 hypothetical protein BSZ36_09265 [Rubricoccus marinus]